MAPDRQERGLWRGRQIVRVRRSQARGQSHGNIPGMKSHL